MIDAAEEVVESWYVPRGFPRYDACGGQNYFELQWGQFDRDPDSSPV